MKSKIFLALFIISALFVAAVIIYRVRLAADWAKPIDSVVSQLETNAQYQERFIAEDELGVHQFLDMLGWTDEALRNDGRRLKGITQTKGLVWLCFYGEQEDEYKMISTYEEAKSWLNRAISKRIWQ